MTTPTTSSETDDEHGVIAAVIEAMMRGGSDGLPIPCGCGNPHPRVTRHLIDYDPAAWRRLRVSVLKRDSYRCQVPDPEGQGVCGRPANVAGHVLGRRLGGCDRSSNLRAECKPHSDSDGGVQGNDERAAMEVARTLVTMSRSVTDPGSLGGARHMPPAMNKVSLSGGAGGKRAGQGRGGMDARSELTGGRDASVTLDPAPLTVRNTPGPDDPVWDGAPWLSELREVPSDAVWPRFMTLPHPRAVGTYGPEVVALFARMHAPRQLRWWQRLAAYRILEHDADGVLVWSEYIGTISRQGGKSWLLRVLALWRMLHGPERWGTQTVLHTGRDLGIVREVLKPAQSWGEANGLTPSRNNLEPGLSTAPHMEGSRWVIKAKHAVYGVAAGNALVDEGWDVPAVAVDEGIDPTMVEQESPQLGLWSTAHRLATALMLERRADALAELFEPVARLLLEWSTPDDIDRGDPRGWRAASPHWSAARERIVAKAYAKVLRGESLDPDEPDPIASFDAQWLNRWPRRLDLEGRVKDEPFTTDQAWQACLDPDASPADDAALFVGVEDDRGEGAVAVAAALATDGRVVIGGHRFGTRREAVDWAQDTAEAVDDAVMLVGASLVDDTELEGVEVPIDPAGSAETRTALPLLRELVRLGQVAHDGGSDATRAVVTARVRPAPGGNGILLTGTESTALLRCLSWVVQRAHRDRA